jgi:hypothetical protein
LYFTADFTSNFTTESGGEQFEPPVWVRLQGKCGVYLSTDFTSNFTTLNQVVNNLEPPVWARLQGKCGVRYLWFEDTYIAHVV